MRSQGGCRQVEHVGRGQPVSRLFHSPEQMRFVRSEERGLPAAAGAGDIGGFGIQLLGCNDDLLVSTALGLMTGNHITMAEIAERSRNGFALVRKDRTIRLNSLTGEHLTVNESMPLGVATNQNG